MVDGINRAFYACLLLVAATSPFKKSSLIRSNVHFSSRHTIRNGVVADVLEMKLHQPPQLFNKDLIKYSGKEYLSSSDFDKLLMALHIYNSRFGHTRISNTYVIPDLKLYMFQHSASNSASNLSLKNESIHPSDINYVWPENLHGFKLGSLWNKLLQHKIIISSFEYEQLFASKFCHQSNSNIDWKRNQKSKLSPTGEGLSHYVIGSHLEPYALAVHYYLHLYGHTKISTDFRIREVDCRAQACCPYLLHYSVNHKGNTLHQEWPNSFRSLKLGKMLNKLAQFYKELSHVPLWQSIKYEHVQPMGAVTYKILVKDLRAIFIFKNLHGHTNIPLNFVVPSDRNDRSYKPSMNVGDKTKLNIDSQWPLDLQSLSLGKNIYYVMNRKRFNKPELYELYASLNVTSPAVRSAGFDLLLTALRTHERLFGDNKVPRYFVIPFDDDDWPRETWGMPLGVRLSNVKARRAYNRPECHDELRRIGVDLWR